MTTKSDFSPSEWKQLISAPHHIYSVLSGVDRESLLMKRKEAKALDKFMKNYGSGTGLVKELIADERNADDSKETVADAYKELESIGDLIERKASGADGDSLRTFLMKAAQEVAESVTEERGLFKKGDDVSKKENVALGRIEKSLKASSADARRRRSSGATAATGAAGGAAAAARQKAEVAARAAKRKAAKAASSSKSDDAAAIARQKAEVAARAAKRKASNNDAEAQKAAVAARAAERKAKKDAEEAAAKAQAAADAREKSRREAAMRQAEREQQAKVEAAKKASQDRMAKAAAAKAAAAVRTYTVVSGDTLSGISLKMYGSANKWRGIFEANTDQLKDPSLIYPGQVLKIPDQD